MSAEAAKALVDDLDELMSSMTPAELLGVLVCLGVGTSTVAGQVCHPSLTAITASVNLLSGHLMQTLKVEPSHAACDAAMATLNRLTIALVTP